MGQDRKLALGFRPISKEEVLFAHLRSKELIFHAQQSCCYFVFKRIFQEIREVLCHEVLWPSFFTLLIWHDYVNN